MSGTTFVSLYIPPGPTGPFSQKLAMEMGTASRIKSRETRQDVQDALNVLKQRLVHYAPQTPKNGLAMFAGVVCGKMEMFVFDNLPIPLSHALYRCDNHFVVDILQEMTISTHRSYGYIVMDGNGALVAIVKGTRVKILQKIKSFIPSKHGKGGQSAKRYAHLRLEQRMMYRKECEAMAKKYFIDPSTTLPNVEGIIIAGSAQFKTELQLDGRLASLVLGTVDLAYGNESGLREAITKSANILGDAVMKKELSVLHSFFREIDMDTDMYFYGLKELQCALEKDAVKTLIITRNKHNDLRRIMLEDGTFFIGNPRQEDAGVKIVSDESFLEWAIQNLDVVIVGDEFGEGHQFSNGFGGIGGFLQYSRDTAFPSVWEEEEDSNDEFI